jgi:glycosyltransferase involved in cell wall biosynthesis
MVKVALVMIVRNEAHCIGRCLESVRPYVDQMIVVDTGSTDATVQIAQEMGAAVHHVVWGDDFSAARNAALDLSAADWNLVLDADEWMAQGADSVDLDQLLAGHAFVGVLPVTSEFDLQGRPGASTSWIPRLLPRGVRYRGRVHEQPLSDLPRRTLPLAISHDGYRQQGLGAKKGRNEALLLRALDEAPFDPYLLYQLGKNYEIYEDFGNAVERYRQALQFSSSAAPFRHDLVVRTMFSLKKAHLHVEAIEFANAEMQNWQESPDYYFALGDLLLDWATLNPDDALQELLPMIEASWLKCLELGDQPTLEGSVMGRGSHLAAYNLAVMYAGLGDAEKAEHYQRLAVNG